MRPERRPTISHESCCETGPEAGYQPTGGDAIDGGDGRGGGHHNRSRNSYVSSLCAAVAPFRNMTRLKAMSSNPRINGSHLFTWKTTWSRTIHSRTPPANRLSTTHNPRQLRSSNARRCGTAGLRRRGRARLDVDRTQAGARTTDVKICPSVTETVSPLTSPLSTTLMALIARPVIISVSEDMRTRVLK